MIQVKMNGWIRVTKQRARKEWERGNKVMFVPWKLIPANAWGMYWIGQLVTDVGFHEFDKAVNEFMYYNCGYNETGKYPAFYIQDRG